MANPRDYRQPSQWRSQIDDYELDEVEQFEKIQRGQRAALPVSTGRHADRMAKKTFGSKRVKKQISQKSGGMHRRRQKTLR